MESPAPGDRLIPPSLPATLQYFHDENVSGIYLVAHDKFSLSDNIHIVPVANRQLTLVDEYLLGVMSVLLIAVVTEIINVLLLKRMAPNEPRPTGSISRVSKYRLTIAFLVSQISHFRAVFHYFAALTKNTTPHTHIAHPPTPDGTCWSPSPTTSSTLSHHTLPHDSAATLRSTPMPPGSPNSAQFPTSSPSRVTVALLIAAVVGLSMAVFALDVVIVVLTQPQNRLSGMYEYNLRGEQPIIVDQGLASYISRMSIDRPCVSPFMPHNVQKRRFQLQTCVITGTYGSELSGQDNVTANDVIIKSWYHSAGADHEVIFDPGRLTFRTRVDVLMPTSEGGTRHLLFRSLDNASFALARHIHRATVHSAKFKLCGIKRLKEFCNGTNITTDATSWYAERRIVELWPGTHEDVIGIVSEFRGVNLPAAWLPMKRGTSLMIASSVVREVQGVARYVPVRNDSMEEDGVPKLFEEKSRPTGVVLLSSLLAFTVVTMLSLRVWLQPVSLGSLAISKVNSVLGHDSKVNGAMSVGACGDSCDPFYDDSSNDVGGGILIK